MQWQASLCEDPYLHRYVRCASNSASGGRTQLSKFAAKDLLSGKRGVSLDNDLPSDTRSEFERYAIAAVC